jgi:hypothetical protein
VSGHLLTALSVYPDQQTLTNSSAYDFRAGGVQVWQCDSQGYGQQAEFCCESESEKTRCCSTSTVVFELPAATIGNALEIQTVTQSSSTSSASSASTNPAAQTGNPGSSPSGGNQDGSTAKSTLSPAARAGIGIGAALGAIAILGLAYVLWRRRRRESKLQQAIVKHDADVAGKPAELYGPEAQQPVWEMDGQNHEPQPRAELDAVGGREREARSS